MNRSRKAADGDTVDLGTGLKLDRGEAWWSKSPDSIGTIAAGIVAQIGGAA